MPFSKKNSSKMVILTNYRSSYVLMLPKNKEIFDGIDCECLLIFEAFYSENFVTLVLLLLSQNKNVNVCVEFDKNG
jgi:hypothetical protein